MFTSSYLQHTKVNKVPFSSVCLQEVNQNTLPDVADMSHIIMCKKQIGIIQTGCHCAVPCRPDPISPIVFPSCHRVTHPQVLPPSAFISSSMLSLFDRGIVLAVSSHHVRGELLFEYLKHKQKLLKLLSSYSETRFPG